MSRQKRNAKPCAIKVFGELACFTRPEFKVERVSYEVITPSAARGIFGAVYWEPDIKWEILRIKILNPIKTIAIKKNEINDRQSYAQALKGRPYHADDAGESEGIPINRSQRHGVFLKDVSYVIEARPIVDARLSAEASRATYGKRRSIFERHLRMGRCTRQPCLGQRECVAFFEEPDDTEEPVRGLTMDLGRVLYDVVYLRDEDGPLTYTAHDNTLERGAPAAKGTVRGRAVPVYFDAVVRDGVLEVPSRREVLSRELPEALEDEDVAAFAGGGSLASAGRGGRG